MNDSEIYRANKRASKKGDKRLKYSYEKDTIEDDSGVYRKKKEQNIDDDFVDLESEENDDEGDSLRGDDEVEANEWTDTFFGGEGYEDDYNENDYYGDGLDENGQGEEDE